MLPYEEPTFTTGQRLRGASNARSNKRRTHIFYGLPGGKGHPQPLCTRNRCLLFLIFMVVTVLYFTSARGSAQPAQQQQAQQTQSPIRDLQTKILNVVPEKDTGRTLAIADEQLQINNIALAERSQRLAVAAKLVETQSELAASQANANKLSEELEAARARIQAQEVAVASAQAAAAASAAAAAAAVTAAASAAPAAAAAKSESVALTVGDRPIQVPGYPPIAIASSKRYSKFYCIGGRGRLGAENDRSCRFQNICYKPSSNQWQFYADPAEQLVVLLDQGKIISEFPEKFLNLRSMGNPSDAQWWSPSIVKSAAGIPEGAFAPRTDPARPAVNVLYHPHYPSNMGHVIGDDLFPIFNLMSSFGMLVPDAQLIISRDCGRIFKDNPKKAKQCDFFLKMLLPGLTNKEYLAATAPDFASRVRGSSGEGGGEEDLVCFEQLLVGNGPWGFQQSLGKAPAWWSYHAFYLNNLGINPNRTPRKQRITVSIKKGKRALANNDELVSYLKEQYPQYEVDALELTSLGGWKAELNYLLDTSILITPCGGVSMSAMFLPHNAALVIVDYFNLRKNVSFGMEERLWANLGYVRPFHYPFTIDEVEMPEGHRRDDYQEMRDWGQVRVDTERMGTIVQAAISHVDNFMVFGQQ